MKSLAQISESVLGNYIPTFLDKQDILRLGAEDGILFVHDNQVKMSGKILKVYTDCVEFESDGHVTNIKFDDIDDDGTCHQEINIPGVGIKDVKFNLATIQ